MVKVGIELHQRLDTKHKLFCKCKTSGSGRKLGEIKRRLHPVPSELGKIDIAAEFEYLKGQEFTYDVYDSSVCEIDADESPPLGINREALDIALSICKIFNAEIVDEIQVMRKVVLDGSTPMSFQRTALIATNGSLKVKARKIGIQTICLEEESSGIVGTFEDGHYRLDRLGIPLVEIATTSDIKNGKEAREVAEQIGLMLRTTGKMQRGIGTIRQDLNISIEGGARVEIKGVQELGILEKVIENEIKRQKSLIKLCKKIKELKGKTRVEKAEIEDATDVFKDTECKFVRSLIWKGERVYSAKFPGFAGIFNTELFEDFRFGQDLNGYARALGLGGLIHSDEDLKSYGFSTDEIKKLKKQLKVSGGDGFVIIIGKEKARKALENVFERANLDYVPEETRRALLGGECEYMRPLPGAARMYPETDLPPFKISKKEIEKIKEAPDFSSVKKKLSKVLNEELAEKMLKSPKLQLFEQIIEMKGIKKAKVDPILIAVTIEDTIKTIRREGAAIEKIKDEKLIELFKEYSKGLFVKAAIPDILRELAKSPGESIQSIVKRLKLERITGKKLKGLIKETKAKDIRDVMTKYRLVVDIEELKKTLKVKRKGKKKK